MSSPYLLLLLASALVCVGPLLHHVGASIRVLRDLVDGMALTLVAGLCLAFVLPHVYEEVGLNGLLAALSGFVVAVVFHRLSMERSWSWLLLAVILVVHVVLDGAVLGIDGHGGSIAWAVVAHRLPVGFVIVVAAQKSQKPTRLAWMIALAVAAGTGFGFLVGDALVAGLPAAAPVYVEAVVAGILLHVVLGHGKDASCSHDHGHDHHDHDHHDHDHHDHDHHDHDHHDHDHHDHGHDHAVLRPSVVSRRFWLRRESLAALGAIGGAVLILGLSLFLEPEGHSPQISVFLRTLGLLSLESAPALVLGYALAGLVPSLLTRKRMRSVAKGGRFRQALHGVLFGLPLPVCSCGVLPLYESLIRRGTPVAAAVAFFVATPELGLDAVFLSVPLLGASLTVARVIAAFAVALLVALLLARLPTGKRKRNNRETVAEIEGPLRSRVGAGLRYGFGELFDHTMPWILLGLVVAAMAEPLLSHAALDQVPKFLQVPAAAIIGVPLYVCASGATPVVALALHKGLSAGAAIAFLVAGPATNITTFGVFARLHGRRAAMLFGLLVTALAIVAGWTVDLLDVPAAAVLDAHAAEGMHGSWYSWLCLGVLAILCVSSLFRQGPRGVLRQVLEPIHSD